MAELTEKFADQKPQFELEVGASGVFDVDLDGQRIFTKKEVGRFPIYGEVPTAIQTKMLNQ
ncbi:MAG: hypothetical protein HS101_13365 [Planctomycetia bacterium]|nr:hypothetical protein [Planctomycetia bacterium]MCC7314679.1 Rdx family protein [Planctomycetota bacterium]